MKNLKYAIIFAIVAFALDQITKILAVAFITDPVSVLPIFNLSLAYNYGVSFSMFYDFGTKLPILLAIFSLAIIALIVFIYRKEDSKIARSLMGLFIGGALGNVADRLRLGAVVDFLDFHIMGYHWPTFNISDSILTIIAIVIVYDTFFNKKTKGK